MSKSEDIKAVRVKQLMNDMGWQFIYFKGNNLMSGPGTRGFMPFDMRTFGALVQKQKFGTSENMISDFAKTVKTVSPDWSEHNHYIAFGDKVWDMKKLDWVDDQLKYVYSSDIIPRSSTNKPWTFMLELAQGDESLARDYLQAIAPLFMAQKPTGTVWFIGDGANGKSSLISALYRIIGRHLVSLTTAAIEDGKATPMLAGVLGNIVREASEARVEDTERYKAMGTHEPFAVRQLYTQETITVDTNFHTIFNANNIPIFSDKTKGARRRTLMVPFKAHFRDDPTFDDRTFTPEFLGGLLTLILEETRNIRKNHYRYDWSDATLRAKEAYDSEVNSAEAFVNTLVQQNVAGFTNYGMLKMIYDNWCTTNGMVPLGITTLKRTMHQAYSPIKKSVRVDGKTSSRFVLVDTTEELTWVEPGYAFVDQTKKEPSQIKLDSVW